VLRDFSSTLALRSSAAWTIRPAHSDIFIFEFQALLLLPRVRIQ